MPAAFTLAVRNLAEFNRTLKLADKQTRLGIRKVERQVAEPVKRDAEELAVREISHIGTEWSRMRIGLTQKLVYVAPKQRRKRGSPRPNLAGLLLKKSMIPAAKKNRELVERNFEDMLEHMAANFNRGH